MNMNMMILSVSVTKDVWSVESLCHVISRVYACDALRFIYESLSAKNENSNFYFGFAFPLSFRWIYILTFIISPNINIVQIKMLICIPWLNITIVLCLRKSGKIFSIPNLQIRKIRISACTLDINIWKICDQTFMIIYLLRVARMKIVIY